jgi:hypothetical protein
MFTTTAINTDLNCSLNLTAGPHHSDAIFRSPDLPYTPEMFQAPHPSWDMKAKENFGRIIRPYEETYTYILRIASLQ